MSQSIGGRLSMGCKGLMQICTRPNLYLQRSKVVNRTNHVDHLWRGRLMNRPSGILGIVSLMDVHINSYSTSASDEPFCRYNIPDRSTLDPDIKQRMDEEEEKAGFLANVFAVFSRRPDEFRAFLNFYDLLMADKEGSSLTKAEKELIVTATSATNGCLYCTVAHGALHRVYSENPLVADQVSTNVDHADLTPRERAIVNFALRLSAMENISDQDIETLTTHGLSQEDVWDVGAVTSFFAMSNRYAQFTAMKPNKEFYAIGRMPKPKK